MIHHVDPSDYSRDVVDDLKALACCCRREDPAVSCRICPFVKDKPDRYPCNPFDRLVDSIKGILLQIPGKKAEHFLTVIEKCSFCATGHCETCPYGDESLEGNEMVFMQHVHAFLKEQGLYNEDGSVSKKGLQIRVSDTLALLKTTKLTKDDWPNNRGGLLDE